MKKKKLTYSSLVITHNATIEEAMGAITDNQRGSVAVVDENEIFMGVVSDGDIRRAMLQGATRLTPISKIVNINATIVTQDDVQDGKADIIFKEKNDINIIPILGMHNKLVNIAVRDPSLRKKL